MITDTGPLRGEVRRSMPGLAAMRLPTLRRTRSAEPGMIDGTARLDRRTKRLVGRLRPGDIAVIDHVDLDRVAADSLVAVGVAAVLNAKPSVSGRYPNLGPAALRSEERRVGKERTF